MTPMFCEGNPSCSLWLTDDGFEIRAGKRVRKLGHVTSAEAVSELDREQRKPRVIDVRGRLIA
jgi:hypothetical protein